MKCPFCAGAREIPVKGNTVEHLIVVQNEDGHIHVHGPFQNQQAMNRLLKAVERERERIKRLIHEREQARANHDFARADQLRDQLAAEGIILEDTPEGTIRRRK